MELRDYQKEALSGVLSLFRKGKRRVCCVLPCGTGKTVIFAYMARQHIVKHPEGYVLFLVHRRELVQQAKDTFKRLAIPMDNIEIAMAQTVTRHLSRQKRPTFVICDECFPKGTKILTIDGDRDISLLNNGDLVASLGEKGIEYRRINHVFKKVPQSLVKITAGKKETICTANHPFMTKEGWKNAENICPGEEILLLDMRKGNRFFIANRRSKKKCNKKRIWFLFKKMPIQTRIIDNGKNEQKICFEKNEAKQSDEKRRYKKKTICFFACHGLETSYSWRKRNRTDKTSRKTIKRIKRKRLRLLHGISFSDKNKKTIDISDLLQGRHSDSRRYDMDRNRRGIPQELEGSESRQKEIGFLEWKRVDGVEIQKRASDESFGRLCSDGLVYNIEVEGNHNYFANGFLVHNCHHYVSKTFNRILEAFPAPCVGLTATPARLDGSGLGQIFDAMWTGPDPDWFVERGWLSEYDYFAPKVNLYDAKWMPKGADFDQQDASDKLDKIGIYGDIRKYLDPRRKTIVYAPTVAMSRKVAEEIGPMARHFDGDTPKAERDATMDAFRRGDIRVLCNCELIGEGVDVPDCDCVMLLRPTKSTALYIQQSMRCLRPNPGKKAVIYDFVGNVFRHGLPTQHHEWSLNGRVKAHKETEAEDDFAIRICSACMRAYRGKDRICPYCGHDNGKTRAEIEEEKEAELEQIRELKRDERKKAWTFEQLVELGRSRGYRNPVGWAYCVMRGRERKG